MPDLIQDALPPPRRQRTLSALHRLALEPVDATAPDSRPAHSASRSAVSRSGGLILATTPPSQAPPSQVMSCVR